MNKQNYKFANSSNPRDAEKEKYFFFLSRQESCQSKSQTRFGVCTFPSVYFGAWEVQRLHREGMHHLLLLHLSFGTCKWPVLSGHMGGGAYL